MPWRVAFGVFHDSLKSVRNVRPEKKSSEFSSPQTGATRAAVCRRILQRTSEDACIPKHCLPLTGDARVGSGNSHIPPNTGFARAHDLVPGIPGIADVEHDGTVRRDRMRAMAPIKQIPWTTANMVLIWASWVYCLAARPHAAMPGGCNRGTVRAESFPLGPLPGHSFQLNTPVSHASRWNGEVHVALALGRQLGFSTFV